MLKLEILQRWLLSWCSVVCYLRATVVDVRMDKLL